MLGSATRHSNFGNREIAATKTGLVFDLHCANVDGCLRTPLVSGLVGSEKGAGVIRSGTPSTSRYCGKPACAPTTPRYRKPACQENPGGVEHSLSALHHSGSAGGIRRYKRAQAASGPRPATCRYIIRSLPSQHSSRQLAANTAPFFPGAAEPDDDCHRSSQATAAGAPILTGSRAVRARVSKFAQTSERTVRVRDGPRGRSGTGFYSVLDLPAARETLPATPSPVPLTGP